MFPQNLLWSDQITRSNFKSSITLYVVIPIRRKLPKLYIHNKSSSFHIQTDICLCVQRSTKDVFRDIFYQRRSLRYTLGSNGFCRGLIFHFLIIIIVCLQSNIQCGSVYLEIIATHVQQRIAQANGGSTNTTRVRDETDSILLCG